MSLSFMFAKFPVRNGERDTKMTNLSHLFYEYLDAIGFSLTG